MAVESVGRYAKCGSTIQESIHNHDNEGKAKNHECTPYWVNAVLAVWCTQSIMYSVSTQDHCMER